MWLNICKFLTVFFHVLRLVFWAGASSRLDQDLLTSSHLKYANYGFVVVESVIMKNIDFDNDQRPQTSHCHSYADHQVPKWPDRLSDSTAIKRVAYKYLEE